ncbi:MAG TPA: RDD family protein [Micromonosporaceae bacterium]
MTTPRPAAYPGPPPGYPQQPYQPPPAGYRASPYAQLPPGYVFAPEPTSPGGQPLAGFDKRLIARLIDGLILGGASIVVIIPLYVWFAVSVVRMGTSESPGEAPPTFGPTFVTFLALWFGVIVFLIVITYLYTVEWAWRAGGQTVGKRVAKIRIIAINPAQALTRGDLVIRFLAEFGLSLVPAMAWVDGLWQLWDKPYRQCLHDKAAKTVVVRLNA